MGRARPLPLPGRLAGGTVGGPVSRRPHRPPSRSPSWVIDGRLRRGLRPPRRLSRVRRRPARLSRVAVGRPVRPLVRGGGLVQRLYPAPPPVVARVVLPVVAIRGCPRGSGLRARPLLLLPSRVGPRPAPPRAAAPVAAAPVAPRAAPRGAVPRARAPVPPGARAGTPLPFILRARTPRPPVVSAAVVVRCTTPPSPRVPRARARSAAVVSRPRRPGRVRAALVLVVPRPLPLVVVPSPAAVAVAGLVDRMSVVAVRRAVPPVPAPGAAVRRGGRVAPVVASPAAAHCASVVFMFMLIVALKNKPVLLGCCHCRISCWNLWRRGGGTRAGLVIQ